MARYIKIGTTEWQDWPLGQAPLGYVLYTGEYRYAADGLTSLMIWDGGLGNVRLMTAAELDTRRLALIDQARATAKAQAANVDDPGTKRMLAALAYAVQELNTVKAELARLRADTRAAVPTVPTRPPLPAQTIADARQAVRDAIDTV